MGDERVLQNGVVLAHGGRRHLGIAGQVHEVHHLAVRQPRHREKPAEGADVPHQRFVGDFLAQIVARVGGEILRWRIGEVDGRQQPELQRPRKIEARPKFPPHEGMQRMRPRPTAKQVHPLAPQAPRARPGEEEAHPVLFDHQVNFVQQLRQPLNLVDDDHRRLRRQRLPNQPRVAREPRE